MLTPLERNHFFNSNFFILSCFLIVGISGSTRDACEWGLAILEAHCSPWEMSKALGSLFRKQGMIILRGSLEKVSGGYVYLSSMWFLLDKPTRWVKSISQGSQSRPHQHGLGELGMQIPRPGILKSESESVPRYQSVWLALPGNPIAVRSTVSFRQEN